MEVRDITEEEEYGASACNSGRNTTEWSNGERYLKRRCRVGFPMTMSYPGMSAMRYGIEMV